MLYVYVTIVLCVAIFHVLDVVLCVGPEGEEIEISEDLKKAGYPQESRHSFVTLRQELVDAFVE